MARDQHVVELGFIVGDRIEGALWGTVNAGDDASIGLG